MKFDALELVFFTHLIDVTCPDPIPYPENINDLPDRAGVYIFLDRNGEVVYVGEAGGGRLREEVESKKDTKHEEDAVTVIYFLTNSKQKAVRLQDYLIDRYKPKNNKYGK